MALHQFLWGLTLMIVLSDNGCRSQQPTCGRAPLNPRIMGGHSASPGAWPWQALLQVALGNHSFLCGGSLINNQWVLTAAHCVVGDLTFTVHLGLHTLISANPNHVSLRADRIICHPFYDNRTFHNDICLLKLEAPVTFSNYIYPVCLASAKSTFYTGVSSWVAGFGVTPNGTIPNTLQEVNVPIMGNNECSCVYYITNNMICAGGGGKNPCQGDSGGPLVIKTGNVWVQAGVVSFGKGCGFPGYPAGYTRVSRYQDWITNITGSSQLGFVTFTSSGADSDANFICPTRPPPTDSIFDGGDSVIHFSHFVSLSALVLSLYVLLGDV